MESGKIAIYLEVGQKKTVAAALNWPGWLRIGRTEDTAISELIHYASRYGRILPKEFDFTPPVDRDDLIIIEQINGDATTDFGAPGQVLARDFQPVDKSEQNRINAILNAAWETFFEAVNSAEGKSLRKGPRGGGRDLDKIIDHVYEADKSYLTKLGWKFKTDKNMPISQQLMEYREAVHKGITASIQGEIPEISPRGSKRWPARYFARRSIWHILDHVWEIEDRAE